MCATHHRRRSSLGLPFSLRSTNMRTSQRVSWISVRRRSGSLTRESHGLIMWQGPLAARLGAIPSTAGVGVRRKGQSIYAEGVLFCWFFRCDKCRKQPSMTEISDGYCWGMHEFRNKGWVSDAAIDVERCMVTLVNGGESFQISPGTGIGVGLLKQAIVEAAARSTVSSGSALSPIVEKVRRTVQSASRRRWANVTRSR